MDNDSIKFTVEAVLFASEKPLSVKELKEAFESSLSDDEVLSALCELKKDYESQGRGFGLCELAGGYQLVTDPRFSDILKRFYQNREKRKLSPASLETLSVIAYKQPVTKVDIEFVRGVNVDGPLKTLMEKGLVKMMGRKEMPGRPILYGTTKEFLDRFGLRAVGDLPPLSQFTEKDIDPDLLPPEMKKEPEENEATNKPAQEIAAEMNPAQDRSTAPRSDHDQQQVNSETKGDGS